VTFGPNITVLPISAFAASSIETVTLPAKLTEIKDNAFLNCTSLKSISLPANLSKMGKSVFSGCTELASVTFEGNKLTSIGVAVGTDSFIFQNTPSLKSIQIPEGVKFIAKKAFDNSGIESVTLPTSLQTIGEGAFQNCANLKSVDIPAATTEIGKQAFYGCTAIKNINVQFGLETISDYAFENCTSLESFIIPASVENIGMNPFVSCTGLKDFGVDPDNAGFRFVNGALLDADMYTLICYSPANTAKEYAIPESVMVIGDGAFASSQFETFVFPDRFTEIPAYVFKNSKNLASITIPKSIESINEGAFYGCESLTSIDIPYTVMSLGDYAFANCTSLATVNYEERKLEITLGKYLFQNCASITTLAIPEMSSGLNVGMFMGSGIEELVLPEYITDIGFDYIFANCTSLRRVVLHDNSGEKMGSYIFNGCTALVSANIPKSVVQTGAYAFANCTSLVDIDLSATDEYLMYGNYTFYNCSSLVYVDMCAYQFSLMSHIFDGCTSLETVILNGVSEIAPYAFANCPSLKTVVFNNQSYAILYSNNVYDGCTGFTEFHVYLDLVSNLGSDTFYGWTAEQTIYIHGFNSYEEVVAKYGTAWVNGCEATIVVLPE
jgi:hypothetical protein